MRLMVDDYAPLPSSVSDELITFGFPGMSSFRNFYKMVWSCPLHSR